MGKIGEFSPPVSLDISHQLDEFISGESALDNWLKKRALQNNKEGASRTYVIACGKKVMGFYSLSAGSIRREIAPGKIRRNMPEPIPVLILARLAVAKVAQGKGIGRHLMRDAILKMIKTSEIIGIRAMLVNAKNQQSKSFYIKFGFIPSEIEYLTLMLSLPVARASLNVALINRAEKL